MDKEIEEMKEKLKTMISNQNMHMQETCGDLYGLHEFEEMNDGGKLLRGMLVLLGFWMENRDIGIDNKKAEDALFLAALLEFCQTAILIQDDVIDGDRKRRGMDAMHVILEKRPLDPQRAQVSAMLFGNIGVCYVGRLLQERFGKNKELIKEFNDMIFVTLQGEIFDIMVPLVDKNEENRIHTQKRKDIALEISEKKTAYYSFAAPLAMGMLLAGAKQEHRKKAKEMVSELGVAYQLQNDLKGIRQLRIDKDLPSDMHRYKVTYINSLLAENMEMRRILLEGAQSSDAENIMNYIERNELEDKVMKRINTAKCNFSDRINHQDMWDQERALIFTSYINSAFDMK